MSFCVVQKVGYTRHGRRFFGENLSLTFPVIGWKLSFKILGPNLLERSKLHKYFPGIRIWLVAPWSSWGEVARPGHSLDPGLSRNPEPALAGAGPPIREVCVLGPGYAVIPRMSGRVSRLFSDYFRFTFCFSGGQLLKPSGFAWLYLLYLCYYLLEMVQIFTE